MKFNCFNKIVFYSNVSRYWLNHNLIRVRPLVPLLREIRAFLDATKEVSDAYCTPHRNALPHKA